MEDKVPNNVQVVFKECLLEARALNTVEFDEFDELDNLDELVGMLVMLARLVVQVMVLVTMLVGQL